MEKCAVYDDNGIWATGNTPQEAIERLLSDANATAEEYAEVNPTIQVALMTDRLAERVEKHGFDCNHDTYRILPGGMLDIEESEE